MWLAFSGVYPMAFDEEFHLGVIRLYAEYMSPFWSGHPPDANAFGAITRDPSYIYHYLMSFPYRLVSSLTENLTTQVIALRMVNIAFFTSALFIWRSVLLKSKAPQSIINLCLLIFVLLPITPFLAAQINYDNLFIPAVALVFLYALRIRASISKRQQISATDLWILLIACLATSLIKYAFLPILVSLLVYFCVILYIKRKNLRIIFKDFSANWSKISLFARVFMIASLLVVGVLFAERYVLNMARYHEPVPDCSKVLTIDQCKAYAPWARNYILVTEKSPTAPTSPIAFSADWFSGMWLRTFFAVAGPSTGFETKGPLMLPAVTVIIVSVTAFMAVIVYRWRIWQKYQGYVLSMFAVVSAGYIVLLWLDGFQTYLKLGQSVAINGRYLLPIALPIMLIGALGLNEALKGKQSIRLLIAGVTVFCMLLGGGSLTFILRSNDTWLWPNKNVTQTNDAIRNNIGPLIPGYKTPDLFMSQN